ncbi:MAG: TenA family protein [Candidatus Tectomicrobia bacterium]|nr:TenA family protein [Candidatus Tectomicrobia bacterium]
MQFHEQLLQQAEPIWKAMLNHRFLAETAAGTIARETFANWMKQDYLFVREAIPALSVLSAKAPLELRKPLADAVVGLHRELVLFERMAREHQVSFEGAKMSPACYSYAQFLLATSYGRSFVEGFTKTYASEKAYLDSWTWVKEHLRGESPWQAFIENWTSDAFRQYVDWLGVTLDNLTEGISGSTRESMREIFLITGQYEILFWDMAATGESWPVEMP